MVSKNAIIIGATTGIGKELARVLAHNGYVVGLVGRREKLLYKLQDEIQTKTYVKSIDIAQTEEAMKLLEELIGEMNGVDLIIISAGIYIPSPNWEQEMETIDVNVSGFVSMVNVALNYFCERGSGHIVGISSIGALTGGPQSPAYHASKAFVSNYLEGLRRKINRLGVNVIVTDIKPGYIDTPMTRGRIKSRKRLLLVSPVDKTATQIFQAIKDKKAHAYVTRRWMLIAWLMKIVPNSLSSKL